MSVSASAVAVESRFVEYQKPAVKRTPPVPPSSGPNSCSPGRWLTDIIVDGFDPDPKNVPLAVSKPKAELERLESAAAILESYRFRPRFRILLHPIVDEDALAAAPAQNFNADDTATEETTSHCTGWDALCEGESTYVNNFSMLGQVGALSSVHLHSWNKNRSKDLADYKPPTAATSKAQTKASATKKDKYVVVPDEVMNADYATWLEDPSDDNMRILWETLNNFLTKKSNCAPAGDRLKQQGQAQEFQQDFVIDMLATLASMRVNKILINRPAHYITRSWHNGRIDALKELTAENKRLLRVNLPGAGDDGEPSDSESAAFGSRLDKQSYESWAHTNYATEEVIEDPEVVRVRMKEKIANCPDAGLRDILRLRLEGKSQTEIAKVFGISQQAVSKQMKKAEKVLQAMPDTKVT